jgi:hypothetical protein
MSEQEEPFEIREARIAEEVRKKLEENPDALHAELGNMWMNLLPPEGEELTSRNANVILGRTDTKPTEDKYSALRRSQTHGEFFKVVDSIVSDFDKDGQIAEEIRQIKNAPKKDGFSLTQAVRKVNTKLLPIYTRLRAKGYINADFNT